MIRGTIGTVEHVIVDHTINGGLIMTQSKLDEAKALLKDLDSSEKAVLRDQINIDLTGEADGNLGSADVSADDEKKKYIAQHGDPNAQVRAQDVPEPQSDELKNEQNLAAMEENRAEPLTDSDKAHVLQQDVDTAESDHASRVTDEQHDKLADKVNA